MGCKGYDALLRPEDLKPGKWYELFSDDDEPRRMLCVDDGYRFELVERVYDGTGRRLETRSYMFDEDQMFQHLPDCDGWNWKPSSGKDGVVDKMKEFYPNSQIAVMSQQPRYNPGEGYRLIDVEKDTPQEGDEFWYEVQKAWVKRPLPVDAFDTRNTVYRRRVQPEFKDGDYATWCTPGGYDETIRIVAALPPDKYRVRVLNGTNYETTAYGRTLTPGQFRPFTRDEYVEYKGSWLLATASGNLSIPTTIGECGTNLGSYRSMMDRYIFLRSELPCGVWETDKDLK